MPTGTDYASLSGPALLEACNDDAMKWAEAFCQIVRVNKLDPVDEEFMCGWFANAIEHSELYRRRKVNVRD